MRPSTMLFILLPLSVLGAPLAAGAAPAGQVPRIGMLSSAAEPGLLREAFGQRLRDLGYSEGHNLVVENRYTSGQPALLAQAAAELVHLPVDVIFAVGTAAIRAAQHATRAIPIVMLVGGDPISAGLITSLTRPSGNITGIVTLSPKLSARRLALLKDVMPRVAPVAILFNPDDETKIVDWHQTQVAARTFGVRLQPLEVRHPDAFAPAFAAIRQERTGGLIVLSDALTVRYRTQLVELAAEHQLPTIYEFREFVEVGGLMAYGPRLRTLFQRAAFYVDRLLKGDKPANLPVEQPTTFELSINLKTAQGLGLTIPQALLLEAEEVIR
jgi:putative tryptophan/tyrosine transport system substrate-binding protein